MSIPAFAQQPPPKIGLVLEGGGALGLAHIGVLEYLEQQHIPVHYLAGTSMGGLVAGMYATGKSSAEIRDLIRSINWEEALRGETPYRDLTFRRKEDRRAFPNPIEFGLRGGFSLPSGINGGHQIGLILDRAALPYSQIKSFDELPIPFRCVATELTTNRSEVFKDGLLSQALRATMSIPGVFAPVKRDGKVYADGGLLNNLPVDVVRAMGADIVIAVHLQVKPFQPKDANSPFATLNRSISTVIAVNELRSMEKADILISVPLEKYTGMEYAKGDELADLGRAAAARKEKILSTVAITVSEFAQHQQQIAARRRKEVPVPQFLDVTGTNPQLASEIVQDLAAHVGRPVDPPALEADLTQVTGRGRYQKVGYHAIERNGQTGLEVRTIEKEYAPPMILPGVLIDGGDFENIRIGLATRLVMLDVGGHRRELRTDIQIGNVYSVASEYYRPFSSASRWFLSAMGSASDTPVSIYSRGERLAEYRTRAAGGGLDVGRIFGRTAELRLGYRVNYLGLRRQIGDPQLPSLNGTVSATSLRFTMDRMDNPVIPWNGQFLQARVEYWNKNLGSTAGFPLSETNYVAARPVSRRSAIFGQSSAGTTFNGRGVGLPPFSLGGVNRLAAYGKNEFLNNQYIYGRTGYLYELMTLPVFFGKRVYALGQYEVGKAWGRQSTRLPTNGTVGVVMETLLGPVLFGGSVGESGHRKWFFQLGRFF
ncbi:MAG: patatin-like phospholipase family protein [Acidobacteria bacterium]|nr:patatin-like phospholipase family protein [Acidobacteriota bacterium]